MKNIKQISLSGVVFYVEEDGYIVLKQYIDSLKRYYAGKENGEKMLEDMQIRFAKLLSEKRTSLEQAITLSDIENGIAVLGYPSDFDRKEQEKFKQEYRKHKQLYRDLENAKIAGVCNGLSYYFGIDVWVFRLIFICLGICSVGFWILVYFILWIILPATTTTQQGCNMKGEYPDIKYFEQKVKSGIHEAETKIRNFTNENAKNIKHTTQEISSGARNIAKFFVKLFGICMVFTAVCAIATILVIWLVPIPSLFRAGHEFSIVCLRDVFSILGLNSIAIFLLMMCVLLPFIFFLFSGIALLVRELRKIMGIAILISFIAWIVSIVFMLIGTFALAGNIGFKNTFSETKEINFPYTAQHLTVKPHPDLISQNAGTQVQFLGKSLYIYSEDRQMQIFGKPVFDYTIREDMDSVVTICISKNFKGNIDEFQNNIKVEDSTIYIPSLFHLDKNYWSGERIHIEISVPKGVQLAIEKPFTHRSKTLYCD